MFAIGTLISLIGILAAIIAFLFGVSSVSFAGLLMWTVVELAAIAFMVLGFTLCEKSVEWGD